MSGPIAGVDFDGAFTAGSRATRFTPFTLGQRACDADGNEYVYVQANGAVTANDVVILSAAFQADAITSTNSTDLIGAKIGVAKGTLADDDYGWVQIYGTATINVGSSCAANTTLNTTTTAGRIDDNATSGAETIFGLVTTAAESGNEAAGSLNYPMIDATLA